MTDRLALILSEDWAVHYDNCQWMLSKARKLRSERKWHPQGYVGGRKATLERLTREKGVPITPEAQQVIDTWPDRFLDWLAPQDRRAAA